MSCVTVHASNVYSSILSFHVFAECRLAEVPALSLLFVFSSLNISLVPCLFIPDLISYVDASECSKVHFSLSSCILRLLVSGI